MNKKLDYLALGDSYTIGEGIKESETWPFLLVTALRKSGVPINDPKIIANTGWTTSDLKAAINNSKINQTYDLVSLLIGVNDQYEGKDVEKYRVEFVELLETAIHYAGNNSSHVLVLSIPDWSVTPYAKNLNRKDIAEQIDLFNTIKKKETVKRNVSFIDITTISKQAANDGAYITKDELHLTGKMYRLWINEITNNYILPVKNDCTALEKNYNKAFELDRDDPLAHFKNSFVNDEGVIYLDGNSLGKLPKKTIDVISNQINIQWGDRLIRSWNEDWIALSKKIAKKIAKLVGARDDEIFVGDTTSLNLFKLVFAVLRADPTKHKIISDSVNFPSDLYVIQGILKHHFENHSLQLIESNDGVSLDENAFIDISDKNTALITLSHVAYKSSFMYDMKRINTLAHKHDSRIIWDLSHSVGAVDVQLNKSNADMAVGCCYKYLNGGPGAPAFLFVKKELQEKLSNPIWSWFSHQNPFDFDSEYKASDDIQKFAVSTPTILSLSAIEPGLDLLLEAGITNVRKKSVMQSRFLLDLIQENLVPLGFTIASPLHDKIRGSHISIQHPEGYRISKVMIEPQNDSKVIIPDFRPPNNIRLGIAPLYTSYLDLYYCVERIKSIMKNKEYKNLSRDASGVT